MSDTTYHMNKVTFAYESFEEAWPDVDPLLKPCGSLVLVQLRAPKKKTRGGLILSSESRDTEQWNTQVAKVLATGPLAFCNRNTGDLWPEGAWFKPGDYVRVPKYGGDRWSILHGDDEIVFLLCKDLDITGEVTDPLTMKAFL